MTKTSLLAPRKTQYQSLYTNREIREAIKQHYRLPENSSIKMDITEIYPLLGREWRDVFKLYALGCSLLSIAYYWAVIQEKEKKTLHRNSGNALITKLVNKIQWLLSFDLKETYIPSLSIREKRKEQNEPANN